MEEQKPKASKFIINYGVILGIVSILISVVMYVTNLYIEKSWIAGTLSFIAMVAILIYGINEFKKNNAGFLSLGQAIKLGIGMALVAGIIGVVYNLIFVNFIEPDFMEQMMQMQFDKMVEDNPNMTQEQLEMSMEMGRKFSSPWITSAISIVGSLFLGLIISLIGGLIMKKENNHA
ncbi:DUF4199 domain-containing protein [Subsaxibacter sp. CAU 1640]|uniref:DUF4199 domain-containing protein n=1 Tax=Subsaxibacter sp. CAU 1640 TaxID=2933271 RepID=UPI002003181B|nr:DUF4199 domain-containing protein [Subsaxibacter sp. CAU 1640]MCK7589962.1 DUF4199 domain-containing protein [Subsaxibacter sp. CAU 1640]